MAPDADNANTLLREHGSRLILFARQHVARHADAEDIVQEAFVRYWRQRDHVRDPVAYLYRCVRTTAIDVRHRQRRQPASVETSGASTDETAQFAAASGAADQRAISAERQAVIEAALENMNADHREIIVMRIWGDLTFDQIAGALEVAKSTVFSRYETAMKQLREQFEATPV